MIIPGAYPGVQGLGFTVGPALNVVGSAITQVSLKIK